MSERILILKFNTYVINSYRYTKLRMSLSESSYDAFDCKDCKTLGSTCNLNHSLCISGIFKLEFTFLYTFSLDFDCPLSSFIVIL